MSEFYFIGVSTAQSSSRQMFPLWMEALGRPEVRWTGLDLPLHAPPEQYRAVVHRIKTEPDVLGGLVTSHKIDLLAAARDMVDTLGPDAALTGEVSSLAKENGRLIGRATDPTAGGLSLDGLLGPDYFARTGGEVLCLGAGGSGTALSLHLTRRADRPRRVLVVNRSWERLGQLRTLLDARQSDIHFHYICNEDPVYNDKLMALMPTGSVVNNATGLGKDRPGSPVSEAGRFPKNGVVWELNYRGSLEFWHQARAQQDCRGLTVADGWDYFVHGWAQVISHVLHLDLSPDQLQTLSELAARVRRKA